MLGHAGVIRCRRVAVLVRLRGADRRRVRIARIGKVQGHRAVAVAARHAVGPAGDSTVGSNVQGCGHTIVDHRHRRAAVGGQIRRIQGNGRDGNAGGSLGGDFAARQHTVLVGIARDRHGRRSRRTDVFRDRRRIAIGGVAELIRLRGRDRCAVRIAGVGERNRHRTVAIAARHAVRAAGYRAVGSDIERGRHAVVDHGHGCAAVGRQAGGV